MDFGLGSKVNVSDNMIRTIGGMDNQHGSYSEPNAEFEIGLEYGSYEWCGSIGEYRLTCDGDCLCNAGTILITIKITMNDALRFVVGRIEIYDSVGSLIQYSRDFAEAYRYYTMNFIIDERRIGTTLMVVFVQKTTRRNVHKCEIVVPPLVILGDSDVCVFCLSSVVDVNNKYVSPCAHLFHLDCLFQYLRHNDLLDYKNDWCEYIACGHGNTSGEFLCPVCKSVIGEKESGGDF